MNEHYFLDSIYSYAGARRMEAVLHEAIKGYLHFVFDRSWLHWLAKHLCNVQESYILDNPRVHKVDIRIVDNPLVPGHTDLCAGNIVAHFVQVKGVRTVDNQPPQKC